MPAQGQVVYLVCCSAPFDKSLGRCVVLGRAAEAAKARLTELRGPIRGWGRTPHPGNQAMDGLFAGPAQAGERPERAALPKPHSTKPPPA